MGNLLTDLRHAARSLAKSRAFTVVAVLTLALGIGINASIFSVVNGVLLQPLPYENPDRLAVLWGEMSQRGVTHFPFSPVQLDDYRERTAAFEDLAGVVTFPQTIAGGDGETLPVTAGIATWNLLDVLGAEPMLGRGFGPADGAFSAGDVPENAPFPANTFAPPAVALIGHGLWQRRYGGDPSILGRPLEIGGNSVTVVGIMPPDFRLLLPPQSGAQEQVDVWVPIRVDMENSPRFNNFLTAVGRLREGATLASVNAELEAVDAHLRGEHTVLETSGFGTRVVGLHDAVVADIRPAVLLLLGAVGVVLLIACVNVANLLLVRANGRARELAIRAALGSSRARLVRQLMLESAVLALVGGALGIALAVGALQLLVTLDPQNLPRLGDVGLDAAVLGYACGIALLSALAAGLAPAIRYSRPDIAERLRDRAGSAGGAAGGRLFRRLMVVAEIAMSVVLLIAAGLMVRSFVSLQQADPGYRPEGVLTFQINLPPDTYPTEAEQSEYNLQLKRRLEAMPGVTAVGGGFPLPLSNIPIHSRYATDVADFQSEKARQADLRVVVPGYLDAMGTRLLAGRALTVDDERNARPYVLVDRNLAERVWPGENAVGRTLFLRLATTDPVRMEVAGVVEHQRSEALHRDSRDAIYLPQRVAAGLGGSMFWTVRAAGDLSSLAAPVREAIAGLDPEVMPGAMQPLAAYVHRAMAPTRFALFLIGTFGLVAVLLAVVGLYAVIAYLVRQRVAEFGIRMSLGATRGRIFKLVLGQGMALTAAGIAVGLGGALLLTRGMNSLLVGITPIDGPTYAATVLLFVAASAAACAIPALRATRVDPTTALRQE